MLYEMVTVSSVDFCVPPAYCAWLIEVLSCLNKDSFIRSLLYLEGVVCADLISKVNEYAVQFISGCL